MNTNNHLPVALNTTLSCPQDSQQCTSLLTAYDNPDDRSTQALILTFQDRSVTSVPCTISTSGGSKRTVGTITILPATSSGPAQAINATQNFTLSLFADAPPGICSFTFIATDQDYGVSQPATATINVTHVNHAPVAVNFAGNTDEDLPLSGKLVGNDFKDNNPNIRFLLVNQTSIGLRGQMSLRNDGTFLYTPNFASIGVEYFAFVVTDNELNSTISSITLTINPVNHRPVTSNNALSVMQDSASTFGCLQAADRDIPRGDMLTYQVPGNDSSFVITGPATLTGNTTCLPFAYTPPKYFNGYRLVQFTVTDSGGLTASGTLNITVVFVNQLPVPLTQNFTVLEYASKSGYLQSYDVETPSNQLTYDVVVSPVNGSLTISKAGIYLYTPNRGFSGNDSFTYRVTDTNGGSSQQQVSITVVFVNIPPTTNNMYFIGNEEQTLNGRLIGNDPDGSSSELVFTFSSLDALQSNGTFQTNPNGTFVFIPRSNFTGRLTFGFLATDPHGDTSGTPSTATVIIQGVNHAPYVTRDTRLLF